MASSFHEEYLKQIPQKWNSDAGSIMKTASVLAEAKEQLPKTAYKDLIRELKFAPRTDQRLRKIGNDKRLYDPTVLTSLPDSWSTIDRISSLSDTKFKALVDSGILKPSVKRGQIENFKSGVPKKKKSDWSGTEKLITVRVRGVVDPDEAQDILDEFQYTADGVNRKYECEVVEIEDYELPSKLETKQAKEAIREIERAAREGLKIGRKICRYATQQMKKKAPAWLKEQVRNGQKSTTWSMEENNSPNDYEDLRRAFGELNIDLDVEELHRDSDSAREYYEKMKQIGVW